MKHFLAVVAMLLVSPVFAQGNKLITICTESSGQAFFFEQGVTGAGASGWQKDGISNGMIGLLKKGDNYNIIIIDGTQAIQDYASQGYIILPVMADIQSNRYIITALNGGLVETYLFKLDHNGFGTVAWTASKGNNYITKASLMTARCAPYEFLEKLLNK